MVERRNAVALVGGTLAVIFIYFFILPALGISPPNPFQPHAVVAISPYCSIIVPGQCIIQPQHISITFNRAFQGKILSSIPQIPDAPLLATVPSSISSGMCQWVTWIAPGGDFKFVLEIPKLNYRRVIVNHLESTPEDIDFTGIPMVEGMNYNYRLRVLWAPTDAQCLYKDGVASI